MSMHRTRGFDHNSSDDDLHGDNTAELTADQFFVATGGHGAHHGNWGHKRHKPNDTTSPSTTSTREKQQHTQYSATHSDVQAHYNIVTANAGDLKDRANSKILRLRNMNNWIKSVSINMFIWQAQEHICALAREIGIDPTMIARHFEESHTTRDPFCMFNMVQCENGVWDLSINPLYPLPLKTELRIQGIREIDGTDDDIPLDLPTENKTFCEYTVENEYAKKDLYVDRQLLTQRQNIYLLDLCGGKGGDLYKYMENDLGGYVLADIADRSVAAAIERYSESVAKNQSNKNEKYAKRLFPAQFFAGNLCNHRLHEFLHPSISFDVVSCQFAFHYSFQTEQSLRRMLENISDRLRPGGYFTCTVPDARVLTTKIRELNSLTFGNDIYNVEFQPTPQILSWLQQHNPANSAKDYTGNIDLTTFAGAAQQIDQSSPMYHPPQPASSPFHSLSPFGIQYTFTLEEAVHSVPEYLIIFPILCQIAAEYGLKPVLHENMGTFFHNQYHKAFENKFDTNYALLNKINVFEDKKKGYQARNRAFQPDPKLPRNQWEGVSVYCVMGFQKVGEIQYKGRTIYYDDFSTTTVSPLDYSNNYRGIDEIFQNYTLEPQSTQSCPFIQEDPLGQQFLLDSHHIGLEQLDPQIIMPRFSLPDMRTAGTRHPNPPEWGPIRVMKEEELINCFDSHAYNQIFTSPLDCPGIVSHQPQGEYLVEVAQQGDYSVEAAQEDDYLDVGREEEY